MALCSCHNLGRPLFAPLSKTPCRNSKFFVKNCSFDPTQSHKVHDPVEDQKLCVFLIEKAMAKLTPQKEKILGIFDLRGFKTAKC